MIPKNVRIADFFARPDLDGAYKHGSLSVDCNTEKLQQNAKTGNSGSFVARGQWKRSIQSNIENIATPADGKKELTFTKNVSSPQCGATKRLISIRWF